VDALRAARLRTRNRIADIAGVSIGTVYQYFPTKEALVQAVVHRLWQAELEALASASRVVEQLLEKRRGELRSKDLAFASHLCVVTVLHAVRVGSRDFTEELDDGRLAEELSDMIARYLVRDPV